MAGLPSTFPRKRTENLVEVDLGDELLVYDKVTLQAHALNGPAAFVWRGLDGKTSIKTLAARLRDDLGATDAAATDDALWLALRDLARLNLLGGALPTRPANSMSRRQLIRRLAAAGIVAPVIASMTTAHAGQGSGAIVVSAMACTTPSCDPQAPCPGNSCCACVTTTENTKVCIIPGCEGLECASSASCPPGSVCAANPCCQLAFGAGGQVSGICRPLCTPTTTGVGYCAANLQKAGRAVSQGS